MSIYGKPGVWELCYASCKHELRSGFPPSSQQNLIATLPSSKFSLSHSQHRTSLFLIATVNVFLISSLFEFRGPGELIAFRAARATVSGRGRPQP